MLLNCSTTPRDSATDIEKISQKGAPQGEQPNRSVVMISVTHNLRIIFLKTRYQNLKILSSKFRTSVTQIFSVDSPTIFNAFQNFNNVL